MGSKCPQAGLVNVCLALLGLLALLAVKGVSSVCSGNTCDECVASSYKCAWCSQQNFTGERCQNEDDLYDQGCMKSAIDSPDMKKVEFIENEPVRNKEGNKEAIQITPQRVKIVTRPGAHNKFDMTFRAANNFPVDLYFLFDSSESMRVERKNLADLSQDIGRAIGDISTNYQMGYGVFQDKVILPFTDTVPSKIANPCVKYKNCNPPFEYKHVLAMTNNITAFTQTVQNSKSSGNIDHPEGSGDAIIQSIMCKERIGWRPRGRKLLIFASNERFHVAGDGKLAGIVIPSDGQCHLNAEGLYDKELEMDYPSIGQLTQAAIENEVHIIFAVSNNLLQLYQNLAKRIPNSVAANLAEPQSEGNIKDIIEEKYKNMMSQVVIDYDRVEGLDLDVKITATSDACETKGTKVCRGLEIGENIEFTVDIQVLQCPARPEDRKKTLVISPASMSFEQLQVELEIICECDCSSDPSTVVPSSELCSEGNGTLRCGICDCNEGRYGEVCECDMTQIDSSSSKCQKSADSEACSGNGDCFCGKCSCEKGFSGAFCECDDNNCPLFERKLCGGPSRGKCSCGECQCNMGYEGQSCDCPTSNLTCLYQDTLCNDVGTCECGICKCSKKGYVGKFCESCPLCGDDLCTITDYKDCAKCFVESLNPPKLCSHHCKAVEEVELVEALNSDNPGTCSLQQGDDCITFRVEEKDNKIVILVQQAKTCPEPADIVPIIAGVVGGVVAVGLLLLLLWKILTTVFDKIEYSKFQEDVKNCKWAQQDNPFYRGATTTYQNPMLDSGGVQPEEEKPFM